MSFRKQIEGLTENLVMPIIESGGYELVDVEYVKEGEQYYLRVFADKEGGITVKDCEAINRQLGTLLDEKDPIKGAYILEVSSPGLDRPLKKEKDFKRHLNDDVEIKLYKAINKEKEYVGKLIAYDESTVTIDSDDLEEPMTIERKLIAMIRLAVFF